MTHTPARYPLPDLNTLPEDLRAKILEVQEKSGFVPNVFLALAHRPDEFRAFFAYHDALMDKPGNLTKAERETFRTAFSVANDQARSYSPVCSTARAALVASPPPLTSSPSKCGWFGTW